MTAPRTAAAEFAGRTCSAPAERSDRMRDIVVAHVPADRPVRVLDLGCGTGSLIFRLADTLPTAALTGIDVSPANIRAAIEQQARRASAARVRFEVADYLEYRAERFDAIVADGVLHLIPGDTDRLARKIAADLNPGGLLICNMPFDCKYNTMFAVIRRLLRTVRSPLVDAVILQAGRLLHGREMDDDGLRERVGYMYIPPERMMGGPLERQFASAGLHRASDHAMRSTSLSQLRHRTTIFARGAAAQ